MFGDMPNAIFTFQRMLSTACSGCFGSAEMCSQTKRRGPRNHPCVVKDALYVLGRKVCHAPNADRADLLALWGGGGGIIYSACRDVYLCELQERCHPLVLHGT